MTQSKRIEDFQFKPGKRIGQNLEIVRRIGYGYESEVYLVRELPTGFERAAKFFFPHRNLKNKAAIQYSLKLDKLQEVPMVIRYHSQGKIVFKGQPVTYIVSEFVRGELLSQFLNRQPGKKLNYFTAIHLLYTLTLGLENIHQRGEYHGDLHSDNIIVCGFGLHFDIKILDMYYWKSQKKESRMDDICDMIFIFYEALGGKKAYSKHPTEIKDICCGLKRSIILKKFKTAGMLKNHLELFRWRAFN